ncbi:lipopolysaccharide biosynthesis protein [Glutamicibacter sp. MNS18]|uniref:lipopolysaccharide biosynthesis protein n=1 Tax=Glutamicibacter sp. MNS18 TaxID=2989817 RepID=UPI0022361376|nr:lipopolysaccharide biosynthesis protein [Glutamicibacter sp. MNS18]MCW4466150.1 lipopolysaccharide biosynthesis protein [Glutamicibacter sp. MNS18]
MPGDKPAHSGPSLEGSNRALKRIASSGAANLGAALLGSVSNFVLIVLVTRFWPAEDAGLLFAATSFYIIALALAHLGADQGLVRFIAWNVGSGQGHLNRSTVLAGMLPSLGMTILVAFTGWAAAPWLSGVFGAESPEQGTLVIRVLAVVLPVAVLYEQLLAICRGYAVMKPTIVIERALRPTLQMVLILVAGLSQSSLLWLAWAWAGPYLLCLVLAAAATFGTLQRNKDNWHDENSSGQGLRSEFWRFTGPRGLARMAQVMIQRADIVIVTVLLGPAPAAIYTAATRFLVLGQVATSALQQVSEPQLAGLLARKEVRAVTSVVRQMTVWSVALVWPIYLVFAVHSGALMALVFGSGYEAGGPVLRLLSVAMLIATAVGPLDVLLLMAGKSSLSLFNTTVALVVDLALCFLLIPHWGILGAGLAWAAAIIAKNFLCLWQVHRHLDIGIFTGRLATWLSSLFGIFGMLGWLGTLFHGQPWTGFGISILTGSFYLGFLWFKREVLMPPRTVRDS